MKRIITAIITLIALKISHWLLVHETIFELPGFMKSNIRKNGLVHYTTVENAKEILSKKQMRGYPDKKSTFPSHRNNSIIWFIYDSDSIVPKVSRWNILKRHSPNFHSGSNHTVRYEVKLLIKGFTEQQIEKMKCNMELGIGCYLTSIENVNISIGKLDNIDRVLGIKDDLNC